MTNQDNVREMRPGMTELPGADPGFIDRFIENSLSHTLYLIHCLEEATSEQEFRNRMVDVQKDVAAWPIT